MGIEKFDPISQPKRLKSAEELRKLPDGEKLVLEAGKYEVKEKPTEEIAH